ncbi:PriCT-2 domain-containing protein [Castellaniella hirudinis]|uniref:PriCT-2 domain-containing protein n=1 Tax=Castellaniella hirudinis TaxID=1144617 RepID=UPI0039C49674
MHSDIAAAIACIPADNRETWVLMAMAVKSELGNDGFDIWDKWSQSDEKGYNPADARSVWKSVKPYGGTTILSLFKLARQHGYRGHGEQDPERLRISERDQAERRRRDAALARQEAHRRQRKAQEAAQIVAQCRTDHHPYLDLKGFPEDVGLIDFDGRLVIPMRDASNYSRIVSLQWIDADGTKKFMPGGAAKNAAFIIGSGPESWLCEGYATGLSIRAALRTMYRKSRVIVCFSAANIRTVAASIQGPKFVVADHDENRVSERYASQAGCSYGMPPDVGTDANDYHQKAGVFALANLLRGIAMSP